MLFLLAAPLLTLATLIAAGATPAPGGGGLVGAEAVRCHRRYLHHVR